MYNVSYFLKVKKEIPMMNVVAEMMIFANSAVAKRVLETFPDATLVRHHAPPRPTAIAEMQDELGGHDFPIQLDGSSNKAFQRTLNEACAYLEQLGHDHHQNHHKDVMDQGWNKNKKEEEEEKMKEKKKNEGAAVLLRAMATRAMSEALYTCSGDRGGDGRGGAGAGMRCEDRDTDEEKSQPFIFGHFGLAATHYTHFTSPIRRYADIVVHRQLLRALEQEQEQEEEEEEEEDGGNHSRYAERLPPPVLSGSALTVAAEAMNARHREAKRAAKECSELFLLALLHRDPQVEDAVVTRIQIGPPPIRAAKLGGGTTTTTTTTTTTGKTKSSTDLLSNNKSKASNEVGSGLAPSRWGEDVLAQDHDADHDADTDVVALAIFVPKYHVHARILVRRENGEIVPTSLMIGDEDDHQQQHDHHALRHDQPQQLHMVATPDAVSWYMEDADADAATTTGTSATRTTTTTTTTATTTATTATTSTTAAATVVRADETLRPWAYHVRLWSPIRVHLGCRSNIEHGPALVVRLVIPRPSSSASYAAAAAADSAAAAVAPLLVSSLSSLSLSSATAAVVKEEENPTGVGNAGGGGGGGGYSHHVSKKHHGIKKEQDLRTHQPQSDTDTDTHTHIHTRANTNTNSSTKMKMKKMKAISKQRGGRPDGRWMARVASIYRSLVDGLKDSEKEEGSNNHRSVVHATVPRSSSFTTKRMVVATDVGGVWQFGPVPCRTTAGEEKRGEKSAAAATGVIPSSPSPSPSPALSSLSSLSLSSRAFGPDTTTTTPPVTTCTHSHTQTYTQTQTQTQP